MRERLAISQGLSSEEAGDVDFRDYEYVYQAPLMRRFFESATGLSLPKAMDRTFGPDIKYPAYLFQY